MTVNTTSWEWIRGYDDGRQEARARIQKLKVNYDIRNAQFEALQDRITRAREILTQLLEIRPQVFYRDRIQRALDALEGK